jgi:5'-deoxy-5'-methylthioadenosine phosphorylase
MLAVIGGSGLARFEGLAHLRRSTVHTPYGDTSAALSFGRIGEEEIIFLARHGDGHSIAPHEVNYRANIWALKQSGAREVVAIATVGGIHKDMGPGTLVVPDQIIDYTWGRASTFAQGPGVPVRHIDFTEPYSALLRARILDSASACGETVSARGVYAATQGPRLETAAEIDRLARDGADLVGMTGMPETALAREAGLEYAAIAVVVNHAAGRGESARAISIEHAQAVTTIAMARVRRILARLCAR